MGRNARLSPGPTKAAPGKGEEHRSVGKSLTSGFRSRENAVSPASGVRAQGDLRPPTPAEIPSIRGPLDSEAGLTQFGVPDPSLLALSRGEPGGMAAPEGGAGRRIGRRVRILWFLFGVAVGGATVWGMTSDVSADVYRARIWVAGTLRSVRAHAGGETTPPSGTSTPVPSATPAAATPPNPPAIPTVDVTQLPRAREEQVQPPGTIPAPPPPAPGAPALPHAPGPR